MDPNAYILRWTQYASGHWAAERVSSYHAGSVIKVLKWIDEEEYFLFKLAGKLDKMLHIYDMAEATRQYCNATGTLLWD